MLEKDVVFKGKVYKYFFFFIKFFFEFNVLYIFFYLEGIKVILVIIGDLLIFVFLVYWVMDDGGKCVLGFYININGFILFYV